jgi:hypothetical protein
VREMPPLLRSRFEMHALCRGCSLPISRSACVVQCYFSRFRIYIIYQPHSMKWWRWPPSVVAFHR